MRNKLIFGIIAILCSVLVSGLDGSCIPDWSCTEWFDCIENNQTRTCNDLNFCGIDNDKPIETKKCTSEEIETPVVAEQPSMPSARSCIENWKCAPWGECSDDRQTRECSDENDCGTFLNKPMLEQACIMSAVLPEEDIAAPVVEEPSSFWSYVLWFFGIIFLGAIGLVGYAYLSMQSPSVVATQAQTLNPELSKYVFQMRSAGYSNEQIRTSLLNSGYQNETVNQYLPQQNPQLRGYTKQMMDQGYNMEQIEDHLLRHGLSSHEIKENISQFKSG